MQMIIRNRLNGHDLGASSENAKAHAWFTVLMGLMGREKAALADGEPAMHMCEQIGDCEGLGYCGGYIAGGVVFSGNHVRGTQLYQRYFEDYGAYAGALQQATYIGTITQLLASDGRAREAVDFAKAHHNRIMQQGSLILLQNYLAHRYAAAAMLGQPAEALEWKKQEAEVAEALSDVVQAQSVHYFQTLTALATLTTSAASSTRRPSVHRAGLRRLLQPLGLHPHRLRPARAAPARHRPGRAARCAQGAGAHPQETEPYPPPRRAVGPVPPLPLRDPAGRPGARGRQAGPRAHAPGAGRRAGPVRPGRHRVRPVPRGPRAGPARGGGERRESPGPRPRWPWTSPTRAAGSAARARSRPSSDWPRRSQGARATPARAVSRPSRD